MSVDPSITSVQHKLPKEFLVALGHSQSTEDNFVRRVPGAESSNYEWRDGRLLAQTKEVFNQGRVLGDLALGCVV